MDDVEFVIGTLKWVRKLVDDGLTIKQLKKKVDSALVDMELLQLLQKKKRVN